MPSPACARAAGLVLLLAALTAPAFAAIEGYVTPLSVAPGDTLKLMVSSPTEWQLRFARYHLVGGANTAIFVTDPVTVPAGEQLAPDSAWAGCSWNESTRFVIPAQWPSGLYGAECSAAGTSTHRISFVIRPAASAAHADFAILANTNTWNAYNDWGGRSKYTNPAAHYLSFERPNIVARPAGGTSLTHLTRAEVWVHDFLATNGYSADTYSDWDFHQGIPNLDGYKGLILDTHPEYWTNEMVDRLETYLEHGGNLMYIAGNGVYERVEFAPDGRRLTMFPDGYCGDPTCRRPSYFRNQVPPRPERAILGVAYRSDGFMTFAPFVVLQAGHRFFAGTGLANGDSVGRTGISGAASGWEMDTSLPGLAPDGVLVSASGSDDRGIAPANIELLARGGNTGGYGADMTYYATPAGGGVFAVGSLSFGGSLAVDTTLQHIVRNVLDEFLLRPTAAPAAGGPSPVRALAPGAPNPFTGSTRLAFTLEQAGPVRLRVYDVAGRLVRALLDEPAMPARAAAATWDGRDDAGRAVPGGVYLVRLEAGGRAESRRLLRLR